MDEHEWTSILDAMPCPGLTYEVIRHGIASYCFEVDEATLQVTGDNEAWWDALPPEGDGWWCMAELRYGGVLFWRYPAVLHPSNLNPR